MKKSILLVIMVSLAAASCEKTDILNPVGDPVMSFSTGMSKLTKSSGTADAENSGTQNLQAQDFRIWAYYVADDPNTADNDANKVYDNIYNLPVTYTAPATEQENGTWSTNKHYYWPGTEKELKFFAVSGNSQINNDNTETTESPVVAISADRSTLTINNFQVTNGNYNADLMVADFVQQHQADKQVDLNFHHALSKVEFYFKTIEPTVNSETPTDPINVFVQRVAVVEDDQTTTTSEGLATQGTLTVTGTADESSTGATYQGKQYTANLSWALTAGATATFEDDWTTSYDGTDFPSQIDGQGATPDDKVAMKITGTGTTEKPAQLFTTWLMLPQSVDGKKVQITYLINDRQFTSIFPLYTTTLTDWGQNQHIRYTVTLAPNLIVFDPSVGDWDTSTDDVEHQN